MKHTTVAILVFALGILPGCKKKEAEVAAPVPEGQTAQAAEAAEPTGPAIPDVPLTGAASENLVNVFEAGVNALKNAPDAKTGAAILNGILAKYDVADLRAKSKAAKKAGQGATPETKAKFKSLKAEYKATSEKLGGTEPEAFGPAAKAWAKAWGLN